MGALTYGGMLQDKRGWSGRQEWCLGALPCHRMAITYDPKADQWTTFDDAVSWYERNASTGALTFGGMLKNGKPSITSVEIE